MNGATDIRELIDQSPMSSFQVATVVICILLTALDGFDVLAISFASPGIASEWHINRAALGVVLAMELFGMGVGSILLGGLADRMGRRPTILVCLLVMTLGMYAAALVNSINQLLVVRFVTGLGIGGMLASTNAMAAEFSNAKHRNFAVILMAGGYPIGAILGGSVSTVLLESFDWRAIFVFGAICTAVFLLIVWLGLAESIDYLATKRPKNALQHINRTLVRMGHAPVDELPPPVDDAGRTSYHELFSEHYRLLTLMQILAYFMLIMTFYYTIKWIPKIVVDMGYEPSSAGLVLVWANVGGTLGALVLGLIADKFGLRQLLIGVLLLSFVMVSAFGLGQGTLGGLSAIAAATGFFTNASVVGFYALMANTFPARIRASGTGVVIGVGRGGAALGPVAAGLLFAAGFDLLMVSMILGAGALVAAGAIFALGPIIRSHNIRANI